MVIKHENIVSLTLFCKIAFIKQKSCLKTAKQTLD